MRDPQDIVIQPVITEKATRQMDEENVYTFLVRDGVNKIEIGRAVEKLWDVRVVHVRTLRYSGKLRRALLGRMAGNWQKIGRRPSYKKAFVRLAEGDDIELYEAG